ncbi:hypothetical protein [Streptomyces sp. NPDC091212]|uniref:SCO4225 family membrane protein n=1 Tax=Streptomyces sp. NPDC091212 TaxID=3155191 RepID=UPI00343170A6
MTDSSRSVTQNLRHYLVNPAALGYLAVVVAVCAWVAGVTLFVEHDDASFAGVWAFFVTAPTSFLFVGFTDRLPEWVPLVGIPVGAFVQAFALGAVYRGLTGRAAHRAGTSAA